MIFGSKRRRQLFDKQFGRCRYCGIPCVDPTGDPHAARAFTLEHLVPRAHGGTHARFNVIGACFGCNSDRDLDPLGEWIARRRKEIQRPRHQRVLPACLVLLEQYAIARHVREQAKIGRRASIPHDLGASA